MSDFNDLKIKIFADGADKNGMVEMYNKPFIKGLTTNPTLMRKAGVTDYTIFCKEIISLLPNKPLSFEVFSDDFNEMKKQALEISSWGVNVYVKIPITNTKGEYCYGLVESLVKKNVKVNVTAIMTVEQVKDISNVLDSSVSSYVSIFAGRIADTGRDPVPIIAKSVDILRVNSASEVIWASSRELLNIFQADQVGCHIITITSEILNKLHMVGYDLNQYSLDTVKMFYTDAVKAGFRL